MNQPPQPFVSVVMPVRNECEYVRACIASIVAGEYPKHRLEVLVVDGASDDGTREIVQELSAQHSFVRLLDNPAKIVPHAMNLGIRAARGDLIVRMDAHAEYGRSYLSQLVAAMTSLGADNVGGVVEARPGASSPQARAVALILSHAFGVGNSQFRIAAGGAPTQVDTVPFGCYRRELFDRIGLYDEALVRNQDDELNGRLRKAGGRIFLVPEIRIGYVARSSLRQMARMLYQYGYFKPLVAMKLGRPATWRQLVPPLFALAICSIPTGGLISLPLALPGIALLGAHSLVNVVVSARLARRNGLMVFPFVLGGFLLAHLAYGVGYLRGVLDFAVFHRHSRSHAHDMPLSR